MFEFYDAPLYRPPSEAYSLILQITLGCSNNTCTFCSMYKTKQFRVKSMDEIKSHIRIAKVNYPNASKIFLADGNVLTMDFDQLMEVLEILRVEFPKLERITAYAGPQDILGKTEEQLLSLRAAGLEMLYMGIESGSDKVLKMVAKGVNQKEMIEAGQRAMGAGFKFSCTIISGLGGMTLRDDHAVETAKVVSAINPHYLAALTLLVDETMPMRKMIERGDFQLLNPYEVLEELEIMLNHFQLEGCVFRNNHPSNYFALKGVLNEEKDRLLSILAEAKKMDRNMFRPEGWRGF